MSEGSTILIIGAAGVAAYLLFGGSPVNGQESAAGGGSSTNDSQAAFTSKKDAATASPMNDTSYDVYATTPGGAIVRGSFSNSAEGVSLINDAYSRGYQLQPTSKKIMSVNGGGALGSSGYDVVNLGNGSTVGIKVVAPGTNTVGMAEGIKKSYAGINAGKINSGAY